MTMRETYTVSATSTAPDPFPLRAEPAAIVDARRLAAGQVHVWRASLALAAGPISELERTLSSDERARADRFLRPTPRGRYVAARGLLRRILAAYAGLDPASLRFAYGPHGKPSLAPGQGAGTLRFNLSHSEDLALYAIAAGREVGVDVERIRPAFDGARIAREFFSTAEAATLAALPPAARTEAFFACWTRKEAYSKARGEGLALDPRSFDVSWDGASGDAPFPSTVLPYDTAAPAVCRIRQLSPDPGYAGAVAATAWDGDLCLRWWPHAG